MGRFKRSVRRYCSDGKIDGAFLSGKARNIPETAKEPECINKHSDSPKTLVDLLGFHSRFARIHPSRDGNGRVGGLLLFKECLQNNVMPFIIEDDLKRYYYYYMKGK